MGGACSTYGERRGLFRVSVGKPGRGMWGVWTGSSWMRIGTGGGHL